MSEVPHQPAAFSPQDAPVPDFLVELDPWPHVFFRNLGDLVFGRRPPAIRLESAPGTFWPDVFVQRRLPWLRFFESLGYHILAVAALVGFSRFWSWQPVLEPRPGFDRVQIITYAPVEYLPPLDTRRAEAPHRQPSDPELSRQPIISLPAEADNRFQTIVAPPVIKLKSDVALPNIESWSDAELSQRPQLAVAPAPVVLASSLSRIAPKVADSVVAPPPDLRTAVQNAAPHAPQPAIIEPPPDIAKSSARIAGEINIGHSTVIAPAPQLAVSEQRAFRGTLTAALGVAPQVVPPPPAWAASGYAGARNRIIALNLHPAVGAPLDPPAGNRRGAFAATPEGHRGASGTPGISGSGNAENGSASALAKHGNSNLPAGLYVGKAADPTVSPVAGNAAGKSPSPANSVNPRLLASLPPLGANSPDHSSPPERARLSEAERAVFGERKFYSLSLNMPNLNSAGGSWIIRFAEIKPDSTEHSAVDSPGLVAPTPLRKVDPAYPLQLMHENVAGTVIVYAVIHADGSVGAVRILRGIDDRIDPFASQAIKQWQFRPATKNGSPVDVEATFHIPFRPSRIGSSF